MPLTEYFLLWKVTVPSTWIAAILGFLLAWVAVRMKFGKLVAEIVGDVFFTIIIIWKLSVVVTDFQVVLKSPASILYFNGGLFGFIAGIVIAVVLLVRSRKPKPVGLTRGLFLALVSVQSGYQIMMAVLNNGTLASKVMTIVLFAALLVLAYVYAANVALPVVYGVGLLIAVHAFIAALQPVGFQGIPFIATVVTGVLLVIVHLLSENGGKQMEGLRE